MTEIVLPTARGGQKYLDQLYDFATGLQLLSDDIGFRVSARGWGYVLEGMRLINKDQFDRVEKLVNACRELGYLPIDFTAEEEGRKFSGVEIPTTNTVPGFMKRYVDAVGECEDYFTPRWWEGEKYYIQMLVEKIDLKTLFEPVCRDYHIPVATCFDETTEILTSDGWRYFDEIDYNTLVATMNEDRKMYYTRPLNIIIENYNGLMYHIINRATDQLLTPNHHVYVKRQRNDPAAAYFEFAQIQHVAHLQNLKFTKTVNWEGERKSTFSLPTIPPNRSHNILKTTFDMDTWLEFLGYYLSEGSATQKPNGIFRVQLSQQDGNIKNKMIACLDKLGYGYYTDWQSIQMSNKQLFTYLHPLGKSWEKYIPREFMNLPPRQLKILLLSLLEGDGYIRRSYGGQLRAVFITSSRQLSDDVQEIALKSGYNATVSPRQPTIGVIRGREIHEQHPTYAVHISKSHGEFRINNHTEDGVKIDVTQQNYTGKICCVEVPTGLIYVRRNGRTVWSGNSKGWSSMLQRGEYARRFKIAEEHDLECVLLIAGDHDPDGLRITDHARKNLYDIQNIVWEDGTTGYDPENLIINRFGLNYDFILHHNLTWIDNLITGSGKNLASPRHKNFKMPYVQEYLKTVGIRKCEANAIVKSPATGRALCRAAIESYLGTDARDRFQKRRDKIDEEFSNLRNSLTIDTDPYQDLTLDDCVAMFSHRLGLIDENEREEPDEDEEE